MIRRLGICLCLIAIAGFVALPAFAAVQNVKVGGDIKVLGVSRDDFDLKDTRGINENTTSSSDENDSAISQIRVRVDADLSDNVATTIRLLNEREWDQANGTADSDEITVDLASITLKEFLYSPLTLTLGRQELRYGNGLVVGDPDTNIVSAGSGLDGSVGDLSAYKAFDAIKASLDYNPLKVDLVYAKIDENTVGTNDDTTLMGANLNYALDKNNTVLEAYYFGKITDKGAAALANSPATVNSQRLKVDKVYTVGGRLSTDPIENLNLQAEAAYQFGSYDPTLDRNAATSSVKTGQRKAWAAQVIGDYKLKTKYDPRLIATYTYLSGEKNTRASGNYKGWNSMFEDQTLGDIANKIFAPSNAHIITATAQAKPLTDLTVDLTYAHFQLAEEIKSNTLLYGASGPNKPALILSGLNAGTSYNMVAGKSDLGDEIDLHLAYDYTEDVQIGFAGGIFIPGNAFAKPENRDPASQAIASVKVTF